jgi:hypothetical protein
LPFSFTDPPDVSHSGMRIRSAACTGLSACMVRLVLGVSGNLVSWRNRIPFSGQWSSNAMKRLTQMHISSCQYMLLCFPWAVDYKIRLNSGRF